MNEEICKNCKYHFIEEISFDYPQSCCNKENIIGTTEPLLHCKDFEYSKDYITNLQQENKQLKEELENDIDRYEDTISYQLGFDKGKEYMQQRIEKAIEYIKHYGNLYCLKNIQFKKYKQYEELLDILGGNNGKIN